MSSPRYDVAATQEVLRLARKYGIVAFGGFVREHVIPTGKFECFNLDFEVHDLDLWAREIRSAEAFQKALADAGFKFTQVSDENINPLRIITLSGPYRGDAQVPPIGIAIRAHYPGDDSPLSLASYDGETLQLNQYHDAAGPHPPPLTLVDIQREVLKRNFWFFPSCFKPRTLHPEKVTEFLSTSQALRLARLAQRGWRLLLMPPMY